MQGGGHFLNRRAFSGQKPCILGAVAQKKNAMIPFEEFGPSGQSRLARRAPPEVYEDHVRGLDRELDELGSSAAARELDARILAGPRFAGDWASSPVSRMAVLMALAANPDLWLTLGAAYGPCDANETERGQEVGVYVFESPALWVWAKMGGGDNSRAPHWRWAPKGARPGSPCASKDPEEELVSFFERLCVALALVQAPGCERFLESVGCVRSALEALILEMEARTAPNARAPLKAL